MPDTTPTERLTDEQLRSIASLDWASYDQSAGEQPNHWAETARSLAAEVLELRQRLAAVAALAFASDDGSEYEHDHGIGGGHDECPACWAEDIRNALTPVANQAAAEPKAAQAGDPR